MLPHTQAAISRAILTDLRIGQSTADSTAQRIQVDKHTTAAVCQHLLAERHVETLRIAEVLTVYRITPQGLETLS